MHNLALDFLGLLLIISGLGLGLGASTVMDVFGVLGRESEYWTVRAISTDKVAVPLMWIGVVLATVGGIMFNRNQGLSGVVLYQAIVWVVLIANGSFFTFYIIPRVYPIEHKPEGERLIPRGLVLKILPAFAISICSWWASVILLVWHLVMERGIGS
jgi:hypothetical protein